MITTFQAKLTDRKPLTEHVYLFTFSTNGQEFTYQPGQYVILHIPQGEGHAARRLYSMASSPTTTDSFELIVEILPNGIASQHLMKMNIGDLLTVQGPAGMFTLRQNNLDVVFLATGTGIAPIKSMLHQLLEKEPQKKVYLFWGFPTFSSMYLYDELKQLADAHPQLTFINCISREQDLSCIAEDQQKHYALGHVNDGLEQQVGQDLLKYQYYLCGGPKVVESLREYLATKGIPKEQVHFEKFTV